MQLRNVGTVASSSSVLQAPSPHCVMPNIAHGMSGPQKPQQYASPPAVSLPVAAHAAKWLKFLLAYDHAHMPPKPTL